MNQRNLDYIAPGATTTNSAVPLKPCPFCGSAAELVATPSGGYRAQCVDEECSVYAASVWSSRADVAAERWNKRAPVTP